MPDSVAATASGMRRTIRGDGALWCCRAAERAASNLVLGACSGRSRAKVSCWATKHDVNVGYSTRPQVGHRRMAVSNTALCQC
eukprot:808003-Rhodomonas_salina.2